MPNDRAPQSKTTAMSINPVERTIATGPPFVNALRGAGRGSLRRKSMADDGGALSTGAAGRDFYRITEWPDVGRTLFASVGELQAGQTPMSIMLAVVRRPQLKMRPIRKDTGVGARSLDMDFPQHAVGHTLVTNRQVVE